MSGYCLSMTFINSPASIVGYRIHMRPTLNNPYGLIQLEPILYWLTSWEVTVDPGLTVYEVKLVNTGCIGYFAFPLTTTQYKL